MTPRTGSLSDFYDADQYVTDDMRTVLSAGIPVGRRTHPVEIYVRDSQSNRNQTAAATAALVFDDEVDIVLAGGTSETANQVADQCEAFQVPCITTSAPWESWYSGRVGSTETPFSWTYHFFWGMNDLVSVYQQMWGQLDTNARVGTMYPATGDGNEYRKKFPAVLTGNGVQVFNIDPFEPGRLSAVDVVAKFQQEEVEVVTGLLTPDDFRAFWQEADRTAYVPKAVTISRALLFPADVIQLGGRGSDLTTEVWWSPNHPYKSSLTGVTAQEMATDFAEETGKEWVQPLGFSHALFELAVAALADVQELNDRAAIAASIAGVKQPTIVGSIEFGIRRDIPKNVSATALVGGQWHRVENGNDYELDIVVSDAEQRIPATSRVQQISSAAAAGQQ